MHPLLAFFLAAAAGRFPAVDGGVSVVPPLRDGWESVVAFTGHAVIATALSENEVLGRGADGFGRALAPDLQRWIAGPDGWIGVIDVTLFARGTGKSSLMPRSDLEDYARVRHARHVRSAVSVYGDERGVVTMSEGLAGRREMSVEANAIGQGRGWGRSLIVDAVGLVPAGEPVFAAVSPGNARSLRAFLALGFTPIGSEVLLQPNRSGHPTAVV